MNPVTAYREMLEAQERFLLAAGWRKDTNPSGPWMWFDPRWPSEMAETLEVALNTVLRCGFYTSGLGTTRGRGRVTWTLAISGRLIERC